MNFVIDIFRCNFTNHSEFSDFVCLDLNGSPIDCAHAYEIQWQKPANFLNETYLDCYPYYSSSSLVFDNITVYGLGIIIFLLSLILVINVFKHK